MATITIAGELEIDHDRGVIYFHTSDERVCALYGTQTPLRICQLPRPIPAYTALDITHMHLCNWRGDTPLLGEL